MTDLTRRRTLAAAAWAAPAIVVATAAPAYAGSTGAPAITTSGVVGVRRTTGDTGRIDVTATFTNNGPAGATAFTVEIEWDVVGIGATDNNIQDLASGWTSTPLNGSTRVLFTRATGLAASASETLTFSFGSGGSARGTLMVSPPTTTPTGVHSGGTGVWGSTDPIDMDVTGLVAPSGTGNIIVTIKNNGLAPAATQTVAVTIAPTTGTVAFSGGPTNPSGWVANPLSVPATSGPTTIEFTRATPLVSGASTSFTVNVTESGTGTLSATVTDPSSPNNNTQTGSYS